MKETIFGAIGAAGAFIAAQFGGWDAALATLIFFMATDYVTGFIVAAVFHKSNKSETGALESRAGWKGLCRKGMTLVLVFVGCRIDIVLGANYVRDAVCIAFIANEAISIIENAGLMGIKLPKILTDAIDILNKKGENKEEEK